MPNINQIIQPMTEQLLNLQQFFICLPRQNNVKNNGNGTMEGVCPVCGSAVYVSDLAQDAINKGHIGVCTQCAISGKAKNLF